MTDQPLRHDNSASARLGFGFLALLLALGAIGGAWSFQLIGGYIPCALCLEQRIPYYIGIPLLVAALILTKLNSRSKLARLLFFNFALCMAWGLFLAIYHAGAEWAFWPGPTDCGGDAVLSDDTSTLLAQLETVKLISCTEPAGRFIGLSFAGWNAVSTLILGGLGLLAAFLPPKMEVLDPDA